MKSFAAVLALAATVAAIPQGIFEPYTVARCNKPCTSGQVCAVLGSGPTCIAEKSCNGILGARSCAEREVCATWEYDTSGGVLSDPPAQCVPA